MFAIAPLHPLHNAVIEIVCASPGITVAELRKELVTKRKMPVSLQHVYRLVHQMNDEQILVKIGGALSINFMWLSYLSFFCERAKSVRADHPGKVSIPTLREGQKIRFSASSMLEVETVWNHLLVQLRAMQHDEKHLFKFYSHAWWQLGKNSGREVQFYQKIAASGVTCYWLFGSNTPLDRGATQWIKEIFPYALSATPPFPQEGYNLNVYGDYIVECVLPKTMAKHFSSIFEHTQSMDDFDPELFLDLFTRTATYEVTVWKNAKQADLLRAKLMQFFPAVKKPA